MQDEKWKIWDRNPKTSELYYKRATGELDEMESSKALVKVLSDIYKPKMKVLDVGCGAGHYLRSMKTQLDSKIDYTGVDITEYSLELAKKAFGDSAKFFKDDIL